MAAIVLLTDVKTLAAEAEESPIRIAFAYYAESKYAETVQLLSKNVKSEDKYFSLFLLSWILSTCPDDNIRNGKASMSHACEFHFQTILYTFAYIKHGESDWRRFLWLPWVVSASTCAEFEEYNMAIFHQKVGLLFTELLNNVDPSKENIQKRMRAILKLYENGVPLRTPGLGIMQVSDDWCEKILNADDVKKVGFETIDR